ncbi:hypothetical protein SCLCIDRAFT_29078 [Scleroderma citrinum Foug A]|uniref:Uncharacterized protein n=1 Tax=Scleroderma citrinum Foug A TaxID=1036808 RepID=A0A0C3D8T8_9AGAM|nr:hypothetical protein SCLCIDRAFT_29078 [Scleroderma citrinum Foug A]
MNQPTSSCYHSFPEEIGLINPGSSAEDFFDRETCHTLEDIDIPDADYWQDDVDMAPPANGTIPPSPDHNDPPSSDHDNPPPPFDNSIEGQHGQLPSAARFVKTYQGCMETFPGGVMFISWFRNDQYAEQ